MNLSAGYTRLIRILPNEWGLLLLGAVLPWQTRFFTPAFLANGSAWEEGVLSFYLCWVVLLGTWFVYRRRMQISKTVLAAVAVLAMVNSLASIYPRVSLYAWGTILILLGLYWLLRSLTKEERVWVVRGLLLTIAVSALLALVQVFQQRVIGSSWLGIAPQLPEAKGVSVLLVDGVRWLRVYGIFPHPNIFGGWLVFGLMMLTRPIFSSKIHIGLSFFFTIALFLTASRSALLAALILAVLLLRERWKTVSRATMRWFAGGVFVLCLAFAPFAWSRIAPSSWLERRSLNERIASLVQAGEVIQQYPWLGTGLRAYRPALLDACENRCDFPTTSPHAVPLLPLAELGIVGLVFLLWGLWRVRMAVQLEWLVFAPLLLLDHYLWSFWAGMLLFSLWISFFLHEEKQA